MAIFSLTGSGSNCFSYNLSEFPFGACDPSQFIKELGAAGLSWTSVNVDRGGERVLIQFDPVPPLPLVDAMILAHHPADLLEEAFKVKYPRHHWALKRLLGHDPTATSIRNAIRRNETDDTQMMWLWDSAAKLEAARRR